MLITNGREADAFRIPIVSVTGWAARLAAGIDPIVPIFWTKPEIAELEGVVDLIRGTSVFRRLGFIRACATTHSSDGRVLRHSRLDHSVAVAGTALALARRLQVSFQDALVLVVAALLHDVGHSMYSHQGEDMIIEDTVGHEEYGAQIIRTDPELASIFAKIGVTADRVLEVLTERGPLGTIMSVADTCGYLVIDSIGLGYRDFGFEEAGNFIYKVVHSIQGDLLVVDNLLGMVEFLNLRRMRYIDSYLSLPSRERTAALQELLSIARSRSPGQFVALVRMGTDDTLWHLLPDSRAVTALRLIMEGSLPRNRIKTYVEGSEPERPEGDIRLVERAHFEGFKKWVLVGVLGSKGEVEQVSVEANLPIPEELLRRYVHHVRL